MKIETINNKIKQNKTQYNLDRQAAALKRFEYSPLGKKLKKQTSPAEKQYQKLHNTYEFDKIVKKENYSKSNSI